MLVYAKVVKFRVVDSFGFVVDVMMLHVARKSENVMVDVVTFSNLTVGPTHNIW